MRYASLVIMLALAAGCGGESSWTPAAGAWVDWSSATNSQATVDAVDDTADVAAGRYVGAIDNNCRNWTIASYESYGYTYYTYAPLVTPTGGVTARCDTSHPAACCL